MAHLHVPDPSSFEPLPAALVERWRSFGAWDTVYFPSYVGLVVEEIRTDYCRMRLPHRPELNQPEGVVHGGALATLIDTVVIPAIGAVHERMPRMSTLSMTVDYLGAVRGQDVVAHGWVTRRGRSIVFCDVAVTDDDANPVAAGSVVYSVKVPTEA